MMGKTKGETHGYLQGSHETGFGVCLFHMVASTILDQYYQTASHAELSIDDCHRIHTRHNHDETSHFPYTSTYSSTPHNSSRKHNIHHIPTQTYNIRHHTKAKTLYLTTAATQQTCLPDPHTVTTTDIKTNMHHIHTSIVSRHLATRGHNKILRTPPPHISNSEEILPRLTSRTLAQFRTNKSPFLKVDTKSHPTPLCPLCNTHTHDTHNLFNCTHIRTTLLPLDLWADLAGVMGLLARWRDMLAGGPKAG